MNQGIPLPASSAPEPATVLPGAYSRLFADFLQSHLDRMPELAELMVQAPRGAAARARWLESLAEVATRLHEPELPVKIGMALQVRHLGIAGQVLLSCDTLGEAAEQFCRYCRLVDDLGYTHIHRHSNTGEAIFHWRAAGDETPPQAMEQIWAGAILGLSRWLTGHADLVCDFDFRHPQPANLKPFKCLLGSRLRFSQKMTRAAFPASMMTLPVSTHFPEMRPIVEAQAEASLRALEQNGDPSHNLVRRVGELIAEQLSRGTATVEQIAPQLALSTRTLNRRLAEADTSFRTLCETVRRSHAEKLLADRTLSLAEISFILGYHEQSTFQRAFKRWTGMTPGEFRTARLASP